MSGGSNKISFWIMNKYHGIDTVCLFTSNRDGSSYEVRRFENYFPSKERVRGRSTRNENVMPFIINNKVHRDIKIIIEVQLCKNLVIKTEMKLNRCKQYKYTMINQHSLFL